MLQVCTACSCPFRRNILLLSAALTWSIRHMNRPVARSLVGQTCYLSDEQWLTSLWHPIVLSVPNRTTHADPSVAAVNATPVWNSYSIYRCIMEYAVHANGRNKRGPAGMYIIHNPILFIS